MAKKGESYVIHLPNGGTTELDLTGVEGNIKVSWFHPRIGSSLKAGQVTHLEAGGKVQVGKSPSDETEDRLILVRRQLPSPNRAIRMTASAPTRQFTYSSQPQRGNSYQPGATPQVQKPHKAKALGCWI
ncbi:MAG: putative collagen-binding domain-containing protein [Verrucomicrobiia bacterium]